MSALPYHKRYHSDALAGFMALTLEERGAYQTLLDMMYDRGGPLIDNERLLAGYMNCSVRKWSQLRQSLIQKGKIIINHDGMICNNRARKEIENQSKTHRKLIEAGSKGGRTRAENEKKPKENNEGGQAGLEAGLSDAQAIARGSRNQKPDSSVDKSTGDSADRDKIFWANAKAMLQPHCKGDAGKVVGAWLRDNGKELVVAALNAAQLEKAVNPVEYCQGYFRRHSGKPKPQSPRDEDRAYLERVIADNARREEWERSQAAAGGG